MGNQLEVARDDSESQKEDCEPTVGNSDHQKAPQALLLAEMSRPCRVDPFGMLLPIGM